MTDLLFSPVAIRSMELKNRVVMAPMGTIADADGSLSAITRDYLIARARGGCGLIVTGAVFPTGFFGKQGNGHLYRPEHGARVVEIASGVHAYGAKLCVQLGFGSGCYGCKNPAYPPYSASAIPTFQHPEVLCRELSRAEIARLVREMGEGAALAQAAGADAVMLHAYAGYFIDQFQSAEFNKRTDEYGGSLDNRLRFTGELIASIKAACGAEYPVLVKFSVVHGTSQGRQIEEGLAMCRRLEQLGADAILVDAGSFATLWNRCLPTVYEPDGFSLPYAAAVRQVVSIPVLGQNKLSDPALAERAIQRGACDLVALGHGLLADPDWANKAASGLAVQIRPCIGCNECFRCLATGKNCTCAVNPQLNHETDNEWSITPAANSLKVLVIGAGPGGVLAAVTAAQRGHQVQLWEASNRVGGNMLAAGSPGFKHDLLRYAAYLETLLTQSNVEVLFNQRATAQEVKAAGFDKVIVAAGALAKTLPIPGVELAVSSLSVLTDPALVGRRVVVLGGGLVGCETALYCRELGADTTIMELLPALLQPADEPRNNSLALHALLVGSDISVICDAQVNGIKPGQVSYLKDGAQQVAECDTVIMAVGLTPSPLLEQLHAAGVEAVAVGDCAGPRKIFNAVHEGMRAAMEL